MEATVREVAELTGGFIPESHSHRQDEVIRSLASPELAGSGDLVFFNNGRYAREIESTRATAVFVPADYPGTTGSAIPIAVQRPSAAFSEVARAYFQRDEPRYSRVDSTAVLAEGAKIADGVGIGPRCVIEPDVRIGAGTRIGASVCIGRNTIIGSDCRIHSNVVICSDCRIGDRVEIQPGAVIGSDGFGYDTIDGVHRKIPQIGNVELDNDVEIGAGTTVDRGRFGRTWIREGTKVDNLVQIGHNVVVGRHCLIIAQSGIAGSTVIGDHVIVAAQAGIAGHLKVGDNVIVAAQSGVTKNLKAGKTYMGFPAAPIEEARKRLVSLRKVPTVLERLRKLDSSTE